MSYLNISKETRARYNKYRYQIFIGVIIGYMGFYLVRYNFVLATPYLAQKGFTKTQLGVLFSCLPLAYGLSRVFMAIISDRSNPKYFMATGLVLSVMLNFFYGTNFVLNSFVLMLLLMFFNGWVQGMGWPAVLKVMAYWFSECERGTKMSILGITQNLGRSIIGPLSILGIAVFGSWHSIFYFPAMCALVAAIIVLLLVKNTPQSEGLPTIEEYYNECINRGDDAKNKANTEINNKKLTNKEIIFKYVLTNKYLWYLAFANVCLYFIRYGLINWAPTYLREVKNFTPTASNWAYFFHEYAAIPGIIICGWLSDKFFCKCRELLIILCMIAVIISILFYWLIPAGYPLYHSIALFMIGFFIYGPLTLMPVYILDLIPKGVVGTAAGLSGLSGYIGGATIGSIGIGWSVDNFGWNAGFVIILIASALTIFLFMMTRNAKKLPIKNSDFIQQ